MLPELGQRAGSHEEAACEGPQGAAIRIAARLSTSRPNPM